MCIFCPVTRSAPERSGPGAYWSWAPRFIPGYWPGTKSRSRSSAWEPSRTGSDRRHADVPHAGHDAAQAPHAIPTPGREALHRAAHGLTRVLGPFLADLSPQHADPGARDQEDLGDARAARGRAGVAASPFQDQGLEEERGSGERPRRAFAQRGRLDGDRRAGPEDDVFLSQWSG